MTAGARARYVEAYARLREREGRGAGGKDELFALPYVTSGPLASQWKIRRRTFDAFLRHVVAPRERRAGGRRLHVLDLGAGNGWLSFRLQERGHETIALDMRTDGVDGLAAARPYESRLARLFPRVAASFDALPFRGRRFDVAVFNASLHYAEDLARVLAQAVSAVVPGGAVAILDSPFYENAAAGDAMAEEKRTATAQRFGELAPDLLALSTIEYLTPTGLADAARPFGLSFRRTRVLYPLRYEWRKAAALLAGARTPSRFDLWTAEVP